MKNALFSTLSAAALMLSATPAPATFAASNAVPPAIAPAQLAPQADPEPCQDACPDLGDAPDSNNTLGNPMSIHPFGLLAQQGFFPTEFTGAAGTGPIHLNAGSNTNLQGIALNAIDSALGLDVTQAGAPFSRVSNERNAFLLPDQDARKRNIIPLPNPANGRSNRDGFDNAFVGPAGARLPLRFAPCQPTQVRYAQYIRGPWSMNGFYDGPRYINVWVDFNRDGDWADANLGAPCPEAPNASVSEWFVQNWPAPNASGVYTLPGQLMPNNADQRPFWLRISISDSPAPAGSAGNGPAAGYRFGETEDHLMCYRREAGLWGSCPAMRLQVENEVDGVAQVAPKTPVTFTAEVEEEATYPVTVTWTVDGPGVSQITAAQAEAAPSGAAGRLVIVRTIPSPGTPRDSIVLGWYGCITCTLTASESPAGAPAGVDFITPTTVNVIMVDSDGNAAGDEVLVNVGWRAFAPVALRQNP